ncbi:hypothetical protein [Sorangium sp. So ce1151]|uniref:hypothetical protein n=1 Tax=Sorangium sp. So ce1151 TaxID=3133332 RepID=UPI003F5DE785
MIPVRRVREPGTFDEDARRPGKKWLRDNPGAKRPKDFWSPFRLHLARGFKDLCGYAAMLDPTGGTVDHFLSYQNHPELTYEWSNYRFASATLNSTKRTADDRVLDPYEVRDGWFEILLPSLQLVTTDKIPAAYKTKAEFTIKHLKLRDGERVIRWRRSFMEQYEEGHLDIEGLRLWAPLIAAAVEKRDGSAPAPRTTRAQIATKASARKAVPTRSAKPGATSPQTKTKRS